MLRRSPSPRRVCAAALTLGLVLAACGGDDASDSGAGNATESGGDLGGAIVIDGSSTVAPLSEAVAEEFKNEHGDVDVSVGTSGTGGGFTKFCSDEIDIAGASREIKDEEKTACQGKNIEYLEMRVGLDGLAIVTSSATSFVECLSLEQLASAYKEGGATTWDAVDPALPKEKLALFGPGTDSGTYDFFVEKVLGDPKKPESLKPRTDYTASEDDNVLVQGVGGQKNSLGYFGFAYLTENKGTLREIAVSEEDGGSCVKPSHATVTDGTYPLSRPLFLYVKSAALTRPEVAAFVEYYLETAPDLIGDVGYTAAPAADYEKGLADLAAAS